MDSQSTQKHSKNIVHFHTNNKHPVSFVMHPVWISFPSHLMQKTIRKQHATIALKNNRTSHPIIHPISAFIFDNWKHKSYNTMKAHAQNLVVFLNFLLLHKKKYNLHSIRDLHLHCGTDFLNQLALKKKARATLLSYQRTLTHFFIYLSKQGNPVIPANILTHNQSIKKSKFSLSAPLFTDVIVPSKKKTIEHNIPHTYILRFLELAFHVANPIALGIYMQIFGGLRIGEVVNLTYADIKTIGPFGQDGLLLHVQHHQNRTDIKDRAGTNYVKKEREQLVLGFRNWLQELYKSHQTTYKSNSQHNAVFINKHGKPMTGTSYRYYFQKTKDAFLTYLQQSENAHDQIASISLRHTSWSSHIGRGIFTNLIAENAKQPQDIMLLRGDDHLLSSLTYMAQTNRMKENLETYLNKLFIDSNVTFKK
ncbi:site-specific integrase [Bacillus thuringiensis]|uniref:site-specific integrase n=1 Tax=Bacillus thuringiensis TaxID=1428 RepID=UPI0015F2F093|nr:site-specific integrase [Bacillus thuringiensis]MDZ3952280.1 site-specific integrase [Bacillus thuringiensis]